MEYVISGLVFSFFMVILAGAYLVYRDKQTAWEKRNKK